MGPLLVAAVVQSRSGFRGLTVVASMLHSGWLRTCKGNLVCEVLQTHQLVCSWYPKVSQAYIIHMVKRASKRRGRSHLEAPTEASQQQLWQAAQ